MAQGSTSSNVSQLDEIDGVQLRHGLKCNESESLLDNEKVTYENTSILNTDKSGNTRKSDSCLTNEYSNTNCDETVIQRTVNNVQRKYHSKSFSLSENRVAANLNLFQQNRELWKKRTEMQSSQCLNATRILTRNRIAPDLVMDLPVSNEDRAVNSSHESLNSSDETNSDDASASGSTDKEASNVANSKSIEDMTSAERFASQSQCTLKKNERFSAGTVNNESRQSQKENQTDANAMSRTSNVTTLMSAKNQTKPKAEIKPQESTLLKEFAKTSESGTSTSVISKDQSTIKLGSAVKDFQQKSPIPSRNTQKFVSQFSDLKLTGGCLSSAPNTTPISTVTDSCNTQQQHQQSTSLTSFKPQVKVKPQILRKPLVLPPTTPEPVRRNQE